MPARINYPRGVPHEVVFTGYSPLFSNAEILRRLLTPLAREDVRDTLGHTDEALSPYPIDLAREKFLVYVPSSAPPSPRGFALLVFVPPYNQADLPFGWAAQLDRHGFIFVAPADAGNTTNVVSRRVPLALSAEENIVREYPVDRQHIYIGGFSGGSRVAERVALGLSGCLPWRPPQCRSRSVGRRLSPAAAGPVPALSELDPTGLRHGRAR